MPATTAGIFFCSRMYARPVRKLALSLLLLLAIPATAQDWATGLDKEVQTLGKTSWRPMLAYDVLLHRADTHPATPPFHYAWEDTGRGYGYGPGFGHWDLIHEIIDVLPAAPQHAREQLLNDIRLQLPSGFLPGLYWMRPQSAADDPAIYDKAAAKYSPTQSHPPIWVVAADDYLQQIGPDAALTEEFLTAATKQIAWFEKERRAQPDGFLYLDIVTSKWESGVDEGVRFDGTGPNAPRPPGTGSSPKVPRPFRVEPKPAKKEGALAPEAKNSTACIDATSHVYQLYVYAAKWSGILHRNPALFDQKAAHLRQFIQTQLWSERDGFFYDSWVLDRAPDGPRSTWHNTPAPNRSHAFEGMWPMVVGAATPAQASRVVNDWLLRKDRFNTPHPISTIALDDPKFEPRMWRGPVWNSMTYWAARGAVRYHHPAAAHQLLEAALDDSAAQYTRTGIIWEFYSATGGHPEDLHRKPQSKRNAPFPDYLGHNPLLAMARLWQSTAPR